MDEDRRSDETGPGSGLPAAVKWLARLCVLVAGVLALFALAHVFLRPIPPGQEPPDRHPGELCWACHFVSERFEAVEL